MAKKIDYASMYTLRSDGRYQGYYTDADRKRHAVCDKDPEKLYHKIQQMIDAEEKPPTFRDIAELWHNEHWEDITDGTKASYCAPYKRAVERFGDTLAGDISAYDIDTHLKWLKAQGRAASTINAQRVVYRSIFQRAIIDRKYGKIIKYNPASDLKIPKGTPRTKKREAPEDDIVQQIQDKAGAAYFGEFALFLLCTGARRGEALAVKWSDVDLDAGLISISASVDIRGSRGKIKATKTENGVRQVPILAPLLPYLKRPYGAADHHFLFHGEDPEIPMAHSAYNRRWNHYCREMGFVTDDPEERISKQKKKYVVHHWKNTLTAHMLRHGYATMLYEVGIDEKEAAKLMGHADEEMLRRVYAHLRNKKKDRAADRLRERTKNGLVMASSDGEM